MDIPFLDSEFLLNTDSARTLYHTNAESQPIFDYHSHLSAKEVAQDRMYSTIAEVWLGGDHYKWRAMRSNGVSEEFCTGAGDDKQKFKKWAETIPFALRNPLFIWTHLELRRYFGVTQVLSPETADSIYDRCNELLATPEFSVKNLLRKMNVQVVCTTDDPVDDLRWHRELKESQFEIQVLPTYRPDKATTIQNVTAYNDYLNVLSEAADIDIRDFTSLIEALRKRHDFFHALGCRVSDHGLGTVPFNTDAREMAPGLFKRLRSGQDLDPNQKNTISCALLQEIARMNAEKDWVMQIHIGATRNNNERMFKKLGPDTGFDAIGDDRIGKGIVELLSSIEQESKLPKTVLFNSNPRDNELICSIMGCFQDGRIPGKIQHGPGWWFLDQADGMKRQIEALSNLGLLGRFIGMTTDSRSFLSFPRHELFRRILCGIIGEDIEKGLVPGNEPFVGDLVERICFRNAVEYFGIVKAKG